MSKPVLIEYKDGRQYEMETPAIARRVHPDAKVVSYTDGTAIEEPKTAASTPSTKTAKAATRVGAGK